MTQEKIDYMRKVELPFICQNLRDKNIDVNEKRIEEFEKDFNELLDFASRELFYQTYISDSIDRFEILLKENQKRLAKIEMLVKPQEIIIDKVISKIPSLSHWQSDDGQDLVMAYDVIRLIKENIKFE